MVRLRQQLQLPEREPDRNLDATAIISAAQSIENKLLLREHTELAKARGMFGAPTFIVGDEMFWGNDRLDDALALARRRGGYS